MPLPLRFLLGVALALGGAVTQAYAFTHHHGFEEARFYAGLGVASGEFKSPDCDTGLLTCERQLGFNGFVGYEPIRGLAMEAGFDQVSQFAAYDSGNAANDLDFGTLYTTAIWRFPLFGGLALTGRLGAHFWEYNNCVMSDTPDEDPQTDNPNNARTYTGSVANCGEDAASGSDFLLGAGADVDLGDHLRGRLTWTRYYLDAADYLDTATFSIAYLF